MTGGVMAREDWFSEYMVAEFEKLSEAFQVNEEAGEKRATFFVTLAGAVGGAIAFVVGNEGAMRFKYLPLMAPAIAVLLMLGYLTFIRIVSRNVATDRMKRSLSRIRRYFLDGPADMRLKFIPFDPYKADARTLWAPHRLGKGGWVETLGLVNALLVGGLMAAVVAVVLAVVAGVPAVVKAVPAIVKAWVCACAAIGSGVLAAGVAWCFLMYDAARRYRREMWKGADSFILERNAIATGRPERRARRIMRAREGSRWSLEERTWDGKPLTKEVAQVIFVLKGKFTFSGGPCDEVLKAEKGDLVYVPERMVFRTESEPLQRYLLGVWDNL